MLSSTNCKTRQVPRRKKGPGSQVPRRKRGLERKEAKGKPSTGYMTVKAPEAGHSLAVAARKSVAHGIRMHRFIVHFGGTYPIENKHDQNMEKRLAG